MSREEIIILSIARGQFSSSNLAPCPLTISDNPSLINTHLARFGPFIHRHPQSGNRNHPFSPFGRNPVMDKHHPNLISLTALPRCTGPIGTKSKIERPTFPLLLLFLACHPPLAKMKSLLQESVFTKQITVAAQKEAQYCVETAKLMGPCL